MHFPQNNRIQGAESKKMRRPRGRFWGGSPGLQVSVFFSVSRRGGRGALLVRGGKPWSGPAHGRRCRPSSRRSADAVRDAVRNDFISASPIPRVVTAGVPRRTPEVTKGLRVSPGTVFLFAVMCTSSRLCSSSLPVQSSSVRSISSRWLSVPPETSFTPRAVSSLQAPSRSQQFCGHTP